MVANSPVQDLLQQALELRRVYLEVEGNGIESGLAQIAGITEILSEGIEDGRKRYRLSVTADTDPRPEIFQMAKANDWVLWELHEERPRLEDVFHDLTAESVATGDGS